MNEIADNILDNLVNDILDETADDITDKDDIVKATFLYIAI